jgi:hypothetical protein
MRRRARVDEAAARLIPESLMRRHKCIPVHVAADADGNSINVPKRDLVSVIQVLLQTKRLKIPALLPEARFFWKKWDELLTRPLFLHSSIRCLAYP